MEKLTNRKMSQSKFDRLFKGVYILDWKEDCRNKDEEECLEIELIERDTEIG